MNKIAFFTLGCKVNQYETDKMKQDFIKNGWEIVSFDKKADVYIVNSCSVTNLATRKTRNYLSRARKNGGIVVLCGCYAQELEDEKNIENLNLCDIILGNEEKKDVYNIVYNYINTNKKNKVNYIRISKINEIKKYNDSQTLNEAFDIRESIKIEDGCNNFCSYCIIPYVRGRVRSRSIESIIKEANRLAKTGVVELVLVGIEIASYGKDLDQDIDLISVVEEIAKIDKIKRIRLGSLEPRILTKENIIRLSKIDKLCHHFHISVQSLDDNVLKNMNRKYDVNLVKEVCNNLKETFIDCALTCDVIVAFPKESDEEFLNTINNLEKIGFYEVHTFKYSKRKWTRAAKMPNQISGEVANKRSQQMILVADKLKNDYLTRNLGKKMEVLFEKYDNGILEGYTSNYIKVKTKGEKDLCQKVVEVELLSIKKDYILGNI